MVEITPPQGCFENGIFYFPVRIYYEDTDAGGIVYYANYLKFAERARTEFIRALELDKNMSGLDDQTGFVVRHCEIDYRLPAVLGDVLSVSCEMRDLGGASATVHQEVCRGDEVLAVLDVKVAYVSLTTKRPVRIPAEIRELMLKGRITGA